jgi:hypothetical protein
VSGTRSHGGLTPLEEISQTGKWSSTPLLPVTSDPLSGHCGFHQRTGRDEHFAVLLADVECLPDEVLETLAAVVQSCAGRGWIAATMNSANHSPLANVAAAVLHPDRHPCPRCDTDDDLTAPGPRGLAENPAQTARSGPQGEMW